MRPALFRRRRGVAALAAAVMFVGLHSPAEATWPLPQSPRPYLMPGESLGEAQYQLTFGLENAGTDSLAGTGMQPHGAMGNGTSLRLFSWPDREGSPPEPQRRGMYSIGYKETCCTEEITRYLPNRVPPRDGSLWDFHFWDNTALWLGHSRFQPGTTGPGDTGTDVRADDEHLVSIPVVHNVQTKRSFLIDARVQAPKHPAVRYGLRAQPYLDRGGLGLTAPGGMGSRQVDLAAVTDQWNVLQIRADVVTHGGTEADTSDDTGQVTYRYFLNNVEIGSADTFDFISSAMRTGQGDVRFGPAFGLTRGWQGDAPEVFIDGITVYNLQNVPFRTSWLGETILPQDAAKYAIDRNPVPERHVGQHIHAMWVDPVPTPDGKTLIYTNTHWDEGTRATGIYSYEVAGGKGVIRPYGRLGWFGKMLGGLAITADSTYVYATYERMADKKVDASCVSRFAKDAVRPDIGVPHTPFPGIGDPGDLCLPDSAPSGDPQLGPDHPQSIRGLAANDDYLFVGHRKDNKIYTYPKEQVTTGRKETTIQDPRGMVVHAPTNRLWVIVNGGSLVQEYEIGADGALTPQRQLNLDGMRASAVFVTPQGQLYVADDAPASQQIRVFDTTKTPLRELADKTLGDRGGVAAFGGEYGPARLDGVIGVGADNAGNYYVAGNGLGAGQFAAPISLDIRRFNGTTKALEGHVVNNVEVTMGAFDPENPSVVYTPSHRFALNLDAQTPGTEWSPQNTTLMTDRYRCPTDARVMGATGREGAVAVRYMGEGPNRKKFLFATGQGGANRLIVNRFTDDRHTRQSVIFTVDTDAATWPSNEPTTWPNWNNTDYLWTWRDSNGDCAFDDNEFTAPASTPGHPGPSVLSLRSNWSVSEQDNLPHHRAGDIWAAAVQYHYGLALTRIRFTGQFEGGSPVYDPNVEVVERPQPFAMVFGIEYKSATDTLYLLGRNVDEPSLQGGWMVARYDKFYEKHLAWKANSGPAPSPTWLRPLPDDVTTFCPNDNVYKACRVNLFTVAGDRIYVGGIGGQTYDMHGQIRMFDAASGDPAGQLLPGPEVAHRSGWLDMKHGIAATQLPDGRRFVLAEEVFYTRMLLYHGF